MKADQSSCGRGAFKGIGGFEEGESAFYEPTKTAAKHLNEYASKMQCFSSQVQHSLYGNYDSYEARNIVVVFEKCDPLKTTVKCKTDDEINAWMLQKYLIVYVNQERFIQHVFDEDSVKKEALMRWAPLNPELRTDLVFTINRTKQELYDNWLVFGKSNMSK